MNYNKKRGRIREDAIKGDKLQSMDMICYLLVLWIFTWRYKMRNLWGVTLLGMNCRNKSWWYHMDEMVWVPKYWSFSLSIIPSKEIPGKQIMVISYGWNGLSRSNFKAAWKLKILIARQKIIGHLHLLLAFLQEPPNWSSQVLLCFLMVFSDNSKQRNSFVYHSSIQTL